MDSAQNLGIQIGADAMAIYLLVKNDLKTKTDARKEKGGLFSQLTGLFKKK